MTALPTRQRCDPPRCVLPIDHGGECRPRYHSAPVCGAWMPQAREYCARLAGHAGDGQGRGQGHRTRYALDNNREARWFGAA